MHIPSGQISPGAFAKVLVLDVSRAVRGWRKGRLFAAAGLNAGFFISRNDIVVSVQRNALPNTFIQIQNGTGLVSEVGIARENPRSIAPGAKSIATEPAPQGSAADLSDQALCHDMLTNFCNREPGQGKSQGVGKLAGQCLNLNDEAGGKSEPCARPEVATQDQAGEPGRIVFATCLQSDGAYPAGMR